MPVLEFLAQVNVLPPRGGAVPATPRLDIPTQRGRATNCWSGSHSPSGPVEGHRPGAAPTEFYLVAGTADEYYLPCRPGSGARASDVITCIHRAGDLFTLPPEPLAAATRLDSAAVPPDSHQERLITRAKGSNGLGGSAGTPTAGSSRAPGSVSYRPDYEVSW